MDDMITDSTMEYYRNLREQYQTIVDGLLPHRHNEFVFDAMLGEWYLSWIDADSSFMFSADMVTTLFSGKTDEPGLLRYDAYEGMEGLRELLQYLFSHYGLFQRSTPPTADDSDDAEQTPAESETA